MNDFVTNIYNMMDGMATCRYDRPTLNDRKAWGSQEFMECLVYQCARDLARPSHTFYSSFERKNLKNEAGRREAFHRLRGLVMLVCNLVVNYTLMQPSNVIRRIEAARPARNPEFSPIPETRIKWQLDHMPVDELRKKVLDGERGEREEKEWLVGILLGKEVGLKAVVGADEKKGLGMGVEEKKEVVVAGAGVVVKREGNAKSAGVKRAAELVEDEASKRAKTVS